MIIRLSLRNGLLETTCGKWGRRASNKLLKDNDDEDAEKEVSKIGNKGIWRSPEWEQAGNGGRNWVSEAADRFIDLHFLRVMLPPLISMAEAASLYILNLQPVYPAYAAWWLYTYIPSARPK